MPNNNRGKAKSTTEGADDHEFITLGVVRELLQVQERMFKSFIDSMSSSLTKRVDDLVLQKKLMNRGREPRS